MNINKNRLVTLFSLLIFFFVWQVVSIKFPSSLLPPPLLVIYATWETLWSPDFFIHALFTLKNTLVGFSVAFLITNIIALTSRASKYIESFWQPFIFLGLSIPSLVVTFIVILIFGSKGPAGIVIISLILIPEMFQILSPAYKTLSVDLKEMATIYRLSKIQYFKHIFLPQIIPFLFSATRMGISVGWKLAILIEVFTISRYGVGYKLYYYFNLFSIKRVFAWLMSFVAIMGFIEYGILRTLEKKLTPHQ